MTAKRHKKKDGSKVAKAIKAKVLQGCGKLRRVFKVYARPDITEHKLSQRKGKCTRCGACCKLMFECPSLFYDEEGLACCKKYDKRSKVCRTYPLDHKDIAERDFVTDKPCGFRFKAK